MLKINAKEAVAIYMYIYINHTSIHLLLSVTFYLLAVPCVFND